MGIPELLTTAKQAWPKLVVDERGFTEHIAALVADDPTLVEQLEAADLYFAFACGHAEPTALAEFDKVFLPALTGSILKVGVPAHAIDEMLQRIREELLVPPGNRPARILTYGGRGVLGSWLRSIAVRTALRYAKETSKYATLDERHGNELPGDPELEFMKKKYGAVFHRAFKLALGELAPDERLLLKQRFRHQMGVEQLGKQYGVHAGTITRRVQAARDALAALTRTAMMRELGVAPDELASILRLIHSQIDITLSTTDDAG